MRGSLARERLFRQLEHARVEHSAICVLGPPGAGKTTLITSWLESLSSTGIWYQVDAGDTDLSTFFYYLGRAAEPFSRKGMQSLPLLTAEYFRDVEAFSRRFFRELFARLPADATVVMDNYQEVPSESRFHTVVAQAVEEVPPGVTMIIISRRDPPGCYARLIANENVAFLDWDALRLTFEETRGIGSARFDLDEAQLRALHERAEGWAAGLTLLLENTKRNPGPGTTVPTPQTLFQYFAAQIFDHTAEDVRSVLIATADLPWVPTDLAEGLSGTHDAHRVLEDLCARHLFTHRRADGALSYQYHALFQTFLKAHADTGRTAEHRRRNRALAARYFEDHRHWAEAFHLYCEALDWTSASKLIAKLAEELCAQGRFNTLSQWIGALPPTVAAADPWLSYWQGLALVPFAPEQGRACLERACLGFRNESNKAGEVAAAAGIVESIYIENESFKQMDPWIPVLEHGLASRAPAASSAMELRMLSAALIAMLYRQPGNPMMPRCLERLLSLIEFRTDPATRVSAGIGVLTYASVSGDFALGHRAVALIEPIVSDAAVALAHRFLWRVWLGYFHMMLGNYAQSEENYLAADKLNGEGLFSWSANLVFCRALGRLSAGDLRAATTGFETLETVANRSRPQEMGYLHTGRAWKAVISGDAASARQEAARALGFAEQVGNFSHTVIWQAPRMWALARENREEELLAFMDHSLNSVRDTCYQRPHVEWYTSKAYLHVLAGDTERAREALGHALRLSNRLGHESYFHRLCQFAPELRAFAVGAGIHTDMVERIAHRFGWPAPSVTAEDWPWTVRVHTLGSFRIEIKGKPLTFTHKVPRKPVSLLKAIIACGERQVPQARLIDALWPEEPGDAAHHSFSLALHRLRKLVGSADILSVEEGKVSLDRSRVWTDVRAFEALTEDHGENADARFAGIVRLYQGDFLPEEDTASWCLARREHLRDKFLAVALRRGRELENAARLDEAVDLYLRGLDCAPLAETFYQGVMRCYAAQGRTTEALNVYRRLKQTLSVVLGRLPSPLSTDLVRQIGE